MGARSANGWPVIPVADKNTKTRVIAVPGSKVKLRVADDPDVATILAGVAWWVDQHVEDIDTRQGVKGHDVPDDWGWAVRLIRGATRTISNHASGTAIDVNAVAHPMTVRHTWSADEIAKVDAFLARLGGTVRWGEHYKSRVDGMHFEINTTDRAKLRAASAAVLAAMAPPPAKPAPKPAPRYVLRRAIKFRRWLPMMRGDDVRAVQRLVGAHADGKWGRDSDAALKRWQRAHHLQADGVFGRKSAAAAGWGFAG